MATMYATECTCRGFELCEFCILECIREENRRGAARLAAIDAAVAAVTPQHTQLSLTAQERADLDALWA